MESGAHDQDPSSVLIHCLNLFPSRFIFSSGFPEKRYDICSSSIGYCYCGRPKRSMRSVLKINLLSEMEAPVDSLLTKVTILKTNK